MLTLANDIREVERRVHGLVGVCEVRKATGGNWYSLFVQSGTVTLGELGSIPCRSCSVTVLGFTDTIKDVKNYLNILGSWIRLKHRVIRVDGSHVDNPLGYFRVNKLELHPLDGTITITGEDAGCLVADFHLTTMTDGQVTTSQDMGTVARYMLEDCFDYIPRWWSSGIVQDNTPLNHPKHLIQLEGSRVDAVKYLLDNTHYKCQIPVDGSYVFRFIQPNTSGNPALITVRGGQLGNMVDFLTTQDRAGITNVGLIKYTTQTITPGDRVLTRQRRMVEYYGFTKDVGHQSPFGMVTMDVDSSNVNTDAEAAAAADTAMKATLTQARDFTLTVSPVYGIEPGDVVRVEQAEGTGMRGIVVGGTIGLTAHDDWTLVIRAFAPVGYWGEGVRRTFVTDSSELRDAVDWQDVTNPLIDTTGSTFTGWDIWGGEMTEGGSRLDCKSYGSELLVMESDVDVGLTWPSTYRARVRFTASPKDYDSYLRAFIKVNGVKHYSTGYAMVLAEDSAKFEADITLVTTGTFTVGLEMSDNTSGAPLPNGTEIYVSEMDIAVAKPITL